MQQPNPIAFTIGNIEIRWYGILIALGMMLAILISTHRAKYHHIKDSDVLDICIYMLPLGVIGARLYYVLFNFSYYNNFYDVINIRNGGLAIHGGLIFGILTVYFICKKRKISTLNMLDLIIPSVALAQSIGRWGNFFNGEAHGGSTDLPWAIVVDGIKVHPTFLYESIWCLFLFFLLSYIDKKKRRFQGQIVTLYSILYSIERFCVEALRTDSLMIGNFKQAQVLSVMVITAGMIMYNIFKSKYTIKEIKK